MQLIEVSAKTGYVWFRQGVWLFRKNPLVFLVLFFTYLLAMALISAIPIIGNVLPIILVPGISIGFMAACRDTISNKPVFLTILIDGFRAYGIVVAKRLIALGGFYIVSVALVLAASALTDGGTLFKLMTGNDSMVEPGEIANNVVGLAAFTSLVLYIPVTMLFWFAPVLTAWHDVPPIKAMFYSIVSCWRNRFAFMVYAILWFAVLVSFSLGLSVLMRVFDISDYAFALLVPLFIVVTNMLYCSFYATYCGCFGVQELQMF